MNSVEILKNLKFTENNDYTFKSTGNNLLDYFFMSSYYEKHLNQLSLEPSDMNRLFSMFIRDPRNGLGRRDLGRALMNCAGCDAAQIVKAGRFDDLLDNEEFYQFWKQQVLSGNALAKKWAPRLTGKHKAKAKKLAKAWGVSEKQYRAMIKLDSTVEYKLTNHQSDIEFEKVPSLAMLKYYKRFLEGKDTAEAFKQYIDSVKNGKAKLNVSVTNVYDIYRNCNSIDADLYFDKIEKISINCLPVIDTSGSMFADDAMGKALAIGHYLAKCSTFAPNIAIPFSSNPHIIDVTEDQDGAKKMDITLKRNPKTVYEREINRLYTGDCTNTDLKKVMNLAQGFGSAPEYLVVLSDMEFDQGSNNAKCELMDFWKKKGYNTKIVWWNLNSRHTTSPEMDYFGNIFISGYSPMMLKYLEAGFDGNKFLNRLLEAYALTL